jgi:uncharacterized membrane protein YhaH (DUF805 family)
MTYTPSFDPATAASPPVDPQRPWIQDPRDDPSEMNWVKTLFNPFGRTGKLHFSRAWTFMFLGRLLLFVVPVFGAFLVSLAGMDTGFLWKPIKVLGVPIPGLLIAFVGFTLITEFTSFIAHLRRLYEAKRPSLLAILALLPLMLAGAAFVAGSAAGMAGYDQMQAKIAEASKAKAEAPKDQKTTGNTDAKAKEAKAKERRGGQRGNRRGGRPGGPNEMPSQAQMAIGTGTGMALPVWMLSSFFVMLWTLLYVARLPNGGDGRLSTGSEGPLERV